MLLFSVLSFIKGHSVLEKPFHSSKQLALFKIGNECLKFGCVKSILDILQN